MIRRVKLVILIVAGIVSVLGIFLYYRYKPASYPHERYLRFSFTVQNTTNKTLGNAQAWVYGPVKQTAWQLTRKISADAPFDLKVDPVGNQILHFSFKDLPSFATRVVTVSAIVMLADTAQYYQNSIDIKRYLSAEPYIETKNQSLIKLAKILRHSSNDQAISRSNYNWVANNINYAGYIKEDRGALYAYKTRSGDCTEYMDLYTALDRIDGIPTRGIGGYRLSKNAVLRARNYHNWAESYLDARWRVIDPQNKKFLQQENDYIAFKIIYRNNKGLYTSMNRSRTAGEGLSLRIN